MPETSFLGEEPEEILTTDFLGQPVPVSFRGQPALPVGGGVAPGASPATVGGGGIAPEGEGASGGEGSSGGGGAIGGPGGGGGQAVQLALKAIDILRRLGEEQPAAGGDGFPRDEAAFQAQRAGERLPQVVGGGVTDPGALTGTSGGSLFPGDPAQARFTPFEIPQDVFTGAGGGSLPNLAGAEQAAFDASIAGTNPAGYGSVEAAPGMSADLGEGWGPYLAAAKTAFDIAMRASQGDMEASQQATWAAIDALSLLVPLGFGMPVGMGLKAALQPLWADYPSHQERDLADFAEAGRNVTGIAPAVAASQNYDELATSLTPIFKSRYEGQSYSLPFPGVAMTSYPMGEEGMMDLPSRSEMARVFAGDDPNAIAFNWQQGIRQEDRDTINNYLNNMVRQQVAIIRAAEAGDPTAQQFIAQARAAQEKARADALRRPEGWVPGIHPADLEQIQFGQLADQAYKVQL